MRMGTRYGQWRQLPSGKHFLAAAFVFVFMILSGRSANALPAFARKYGLRCSACHESWPMLNYFGQKFKDNGYQLMNDRDAPIWQNPGYWPVTFRILPIWHRVSTGKVSVDQGNGIARVTTSGFDLSGLDFHTGGTLEKNFSFYVLPSSDNTASFHFETVMARLDNLFGSPWLNIKLGKFELDNLLSEKRVLTLTGNGGIYQLYHFIPVGDGNIFGQMGDNQLGAELMGHSWNDRTRYSAALISSTDGTPGLPYGNAYTGFFTFSQAFDTGKLGVDRIGAYAMIGQAPTYYLTTTHLPAPLQFRARDSATSPFTAKGLWGSSTSASTSILQVVTQHGWDNVWFGQGYGDLIGRAAVQQQPAWDNASSGRAGTDLERRSFRTALRVQPAADLHRAVRDDSNVAPVYGRSALRPLPNLGNISTYTVGIRYNPFMTSRAGFAWHNEYNWLHQDGTGPMAGATSQREYQRTD